MIRDREFYRTILRISLPAALQALVSFLVVVADDVMVSKLPDGVAAQAAVAQVNSITAFYTATLTGLVSGSAVLIAQYWGKRDMARIRRIFAVVMWFCLGAAVLFAGAGRLFPKQMVGLVVGAGETAVTDAALSYFAIACLTWLPYAVTTALIGMLRSIEVVKITLVVSVMALFLNVGLNAVLIFGLMGLPAMGVRGAALATLITRLCEMAVVWFYTFHKQRVLTIRPRDLLRPDRALAGDYAKYGLPVALTDMQWALIGMLTLKLDRLFVIKKRDIQPILDYNEKEMKVDAHLALTITIGRAVSLAARAGVRFLKLWLNKKKAVQTT